MILGVGIDIVEIRRIKEAMEKHANFIDRLFSKNEIEYFKVRNLRPEFVAGRFAAKEAVVKAMGTGFNGFEIKDIEIDRTASGKPIVVLRGKAKMIAQKCGNYKIHVSISHSLDNAIAYATMEVDKFENCNVRNNEDDR
ncbi:holo-ACP synthase [Clostridium scatologenes]|uniref:Holo-[acyl-carrier-protein] synthase n=1 Tax=Clostridium scatologenes TaxID=1548 RepID=A0A0E3GS62_CLOSL|nr:holo-ACP synthase [Clostridium scatologenes]AKA71516.1 holo-acyl-carrier-protein synthase [Clostridium scatologenes]